MKWRRWFCCALLVAVLLPVVWLGRAVTAPDADPKETLLEIAALPAEAVFLLRGQEVVTDAVWEGRALAWADENANGQWEVDEPPLDKVLFTVTHVGGTIRIADFDRTYPAYLGEGVTDASGVAEIFAPTSDAGLRFVLEARLPAGCRATTPTQLRGRGTGPPHRLAVGLVGAPGACVEPSPWSPPTRPISAPSDRP